ncbi:unnamed protein product [Paramecium octaurelia]|uniref:Uncharacterized protein n=1 Tax=Paramecium octaurelia TaxID=43137 RepID=A0A8S1S8J9_PAROT|nr:unnamed protein product [Paramecium octaurelia]
MKFHKNRQKSSDTLTVKEVCKGRKKQFQLMDYCLG